MPTHNIANWGCGSYINHCVPLQSFQRWTMTRPELPNLPYCKPLCNIKIRDMSNYSITIDYEKKYIHYSHKGKISRKEIGDVWIELLKPLPELLPIFIRNLQFLVIWPRIKVCYDIDNNFFFHYIF